MQHEYTVSQVLTGHTSPDTAYVVSDYPYGFRLRTSIRYWVETKKGHGQRFVSQTLNPKSGRWNSPKASTYASIIVMFIGSDGHVHHDGLSDYANEHEIDIFENTFADALTENREREVLRYFRARRRAEKRVTVSIHTCGTDQPCDRPDLHEKSYKERMKEESELMRDLTRHELIKETVAAIHGETYP